MKEFKVFLVFTGLIILALTSLAVVGYFLWQILDLALKATK